MQGYLFIHLHHLHFRTNRQIDCEYLSFLWEEKFYFSNVLTHSNMDNFSIPMNHSLLMPITEVPLKAILLQVWENHMIVFQHEVDISELNTRGATRKKMQIRQGEILQFSIQQLLTKEIIQTDKPNNMLLQHYAVMQNFTAYQKGQDNGPSYFRVDFQEGAVIIPVVNSVAMVPLPSTFTFEHVKNGKVLSYSRKYECSQIESNKFRVEMIVEEDRGYDLEFNIKWVSNISSYNIETNALLGAHDILLSQIEIRFEAKEGMKVDLRPEHVSGIKFKVTAGTKGYELNGQLDPFKPTRFGRMVYFIVKSEEEDFSFSLEKGPRIVGKTVVGTDELLSYHPNIIRKKLLDPFSGRVVATVRCKGEKAKNLSLPQNNRFWKKCSQQKMQGLMLEFSQVSLWGAGQDCGILVKSEQKQVQISGVPDFSIFKLQTELPEPVSMGIKDNGSLYFKLFDNFAQNNNDFLGMAVINTKDLRLGAVPVTLPFYKQKQYVCEARMIINKVIPWPFVKGIFHPESLIGSGVKTMSLSVSLKGIQLTSYYWSYLYQGKGDIYCIFELNRVKKVLILERLATTKKLLFISAAGSDLLNFLVDHQESFKLKFTILATDQGVQEEIYGFAQKRIKIDDLSDGPMLFKDQPIANGANLQVGDLDFEVQKGMIGQFKKSPVKKDLNVVKKDLEKVNRSIQNVQRKWNSPKNVKNRLKSKKKYQSLVLPQIKDPKQQRLKRLAKMLQAKQQRKRSPKLQINSSEKIAELKLERRNRIKSQGTNGIKPRYQDTEEALPPIPLTVREEQDRGQRNSDLRIDVPDNQFQENQFLEDPNYEGQPYQGEPIDRRDDDRLFEDN